MAARFAALHTRAARALMAECVSATRNVLGQTRHVTSQNSARNVSTQTSARSLPVGAKPQLLVSSMGRHRKGLASDLTSIIFEQGASITASKKLMVENHYAMMLAVWAPDDGADSLRALLESDEVANRLGTSVKVALLDGQADAAGEMTSAQRRLKLDCPQRPGIVLAITELLKDHSCKMSSVDAEAYEKTSEGGSEIWFALECIVDVPAGVDPDRVSSDLRFWSTAHNAQVVFDKWLKPHFAPLSHA